MLTFESLVHGLKALHKITKNLLRGMLWTGGLLVMLFVVCWLGFRSPVVQTWLCQRAAAYLSDELGTTVSVGGVNIEFVKKLVLEDVYVEDKHRDTLLLAEKLKVDVSAFSYSERYLAVDDIGLVNATIKLKKYKGEKGLSFRFIQKYFESNDTSPRPKSRHPWRVDLVGITLTNVTLAYIDTRFNDTARGMDYEDIRVSHINAKFEHIEPGDTTVQLNVKYLSAQEKCGFTVRNLSSHLTAGEKGISFDNLNIRTPESTINGFLGFQYNSFDDVEDDFVHRVKLDGHFFNTSLDLSDISYFAPELKGIHKRIYLSGDVRGKVDRLRCKDIDIRFGASSRLAGNFNFDGLPDIEQTLMSFKIDEFRSNKKDLEGIPIPPFEKGEQVQLPENFALLGEMYFKGSFDGFMNDFVAHGEARTALGKIVMRDFALVDRGEGKLVTYEGNELRAENFDIGRYLGIGDMGRITASLKVNGSGLKKETITSKLEGTVNSIDYLGYTYRNMTVNGTLSRRLFDGELTISERNVKLDFSGNVDFSGKLPIMNFNADVYHANLSALHIMPGKDSVSISAGTVFSLEGDNLDNLKGLATVSDLIYTRNEDVFKVKNMTLRAGRSDAGKRLDLQGDFITAYIDGKYNLGELPKSVNQLLSLYLPSYFPPLAPKKAEKLASQQFAYEFKLIGNTRPLQIFLPGVEAEKGTRFHGRYDSQANYIKSIFTSPLVEYDLKRYQGIDMFVSSSGGKLQGSAEIQRVQLSDTLWLGGLEFIGDAQHDTATYRLNWDNKTSKKNKGEFSGFASFFSENSLLLTVNSGEFSVEDSSWIVERGARVRMDSSRFDISRLMIRSGQQGIGVEGIAAKNNSDSLVLSMQKFNLATLNRFTGGGMTLRGTVNGKLSLRDLYGDVLYSTNIDFNNLTVNKRGVGDGTVKASWNPTDKSIYLDGSFHRVNSGNPLLDKTKTLLFNGHYYPKKEENSLNIGIRVLDMELDMFAPYVKEYCSFFTGYYKGEASLTGTPEKPVLNGELTVTSKKIFIDYLNTYVRFQNQKIGIEENSFFMDAFRIEDPYGDTALVYGHVFHDHLTNFQLDIDATLNRFQVMNTTAKQNEYYYGTLFATGNVNFFGFLDNIRIDANVKTDKISVGDKLNKKVLYSSFNIPMETVSEVSDNDFITFVKDTTKQKPVVQNTGTGIAMNLNVEATPDCEVKVIFDPKVGDEIIATGSGNLEMNITPNGDFTLKGPYTVESGSYLFTLKNLIAKQFILNKGGSITWSGDPYKADIRMTAIYKVKTSVKPFFPYDSLDVYKAQYPVECRLNLNGDLMRPDISFDVELPNADPRVQEGVARFLSTEEEKNKQVFALLVMNSFITPQEYQALGYSAGTNNAFASTGSELLSAQISNWLSQISKDFNVGVKYRPNDELSKEELRVYMGTQVFNDRLTIDGNFAVINQSTTTNNVVGDVNVEYKLTDDGRVRLKAFNRANDNTLTNGNAPYTQGVGVFYREDFNTIAELYTRYLEWLKTDRKAHEPKKPEQP